LIKTGKLKTSDYDCNYLFCNGKKIYIFLNGTIGVKEFFLDFKKYKKKNEGFLLVDLPGFGSSNFKKKINKSIVKAHVEALKKIILQEKILNFSLILFSLSTVYLITMEKIIFFQKNVKKIFFIDPSFDLSDTSWSKKINQMNKTDYMNYIKFYKRNLNSIFHSSLITKKKYNNVCNNMKMFDNLVLYKFNQECIKILKRKLISSCFENTEKYFLYPETKKIVKVKNNFNNNFFLNKCGHFIFLDRPHKTFALIRKYA
jgi:hypothetical protein